VSLNDHTLEAMDHRSLPVFSVQYHPEASPGPHDNDAHFDRFVRLAAESAGIPISTPPPTAHAAGGSSHAAA
jgi:carbamoylphosphate synthase small subunit